MGIKRLKYIKFHQAVQITTESNSFNTTYLKQDDVRVHNLEILMIDNTVFQITGDNMTQVICTTVNNVPYFEIFEEDRFTLGTDSRTKGMDAQVRSRGKEKHQAPSTTQ
jgi:hypothetical protein